MLACTWIQAYAQTTILFGSPNEALAMGYADAEIMVRSPNDPQALSKVSSSKIHVSIVGVPGEKNRLSSIVGVLGKKNRLIHKFYQRFPLQNHVNIVGVLEKKSPNSQVLSKVSSSKPRQNRQCSGKKSPNPQVLSKISSSKPRQLRRCSGKKDRLIHKVSSKSLQHRWCSGEKKPA